LCYSLSKKRRNYKLKYMPRPSKQCRPNNSNRLNQNKSTVASPKTQTKHRTPQGEANIENRREGSQSVHAHRRKKKNYHGAATNRGWPERWFETNETKFIRPGERLFLSNKQRIVLHIWDDSSLEQRSGHWFGTTRPIRVLCATNNTWHRGLPENMTIFLKKYLQLYCKSQKWVRCRKSQTT
jgi:hypothetical protein